MEWTATKYKGGKNFRIIQNTPKIISIQQMLQLLIHFYLSVNILIMDKLYLLNTFDMM